MATSSAKYLRKHSFKILTVRYTVLLLLVASCASGAIGNQIVQEDHLGIHNHEHNANAFLPSEDKDEIQKLSPSEQRKRLVEIVKKIDTDSDKHLTPEEITLWIQKVYRTYALDDAEERFPEFDLNNDGLVSWDEYNMVMHGHTVEVDEDAAFEDPEEESLRFLHGKEKRRFDFADMDGSAGLNLIEFLAFTHPSEVDHMADFAIEDVLSEYDLDKDGFISLSEFIGDLRTNEQDEPSQWEVEETVRFKDLYDQDRDGKLNRDEQVRWVAPNSYGSAREEAIHLIKEMDQDGDERLSQAEILKNQDIFMNSEVTDYGRQLHVPHDEL
ncbi:reticulocalbin-2-like isoform X2 [Myxocyprinus asiaticus]|uniref:reticulocalbin-2-like isoform X2 n=1 Tax=Myxocyprinus asiaticus TaxID=70543 RepID=UPI0022219AAC|nr:reticulocalbin-2-like isoform X2 [Myxocyprinus asiaticus]